MAPWQSNVVAILAIAALVATAYLAADCAPDAPHKAAESFTSVTTEDRIQLPSGSYYVTRTVEELRTNIKE